MGTLIGQELYKMIHRVGTWIGLGLIVVVEIGMALFRYFKPDIANVADLFGGDYFGTTLILFIMIVSTATIFSMEFQYGTIRQLLYRQYYRSQVFISKIIALVIEYVVLKVVAIGLSYLLTLILFPSFDWSQDLGTHTLLQQYWLQQAGGALSLLMLLSVVLMFAVLFKNNAASIAIGFVTYFVVQIAASFLLILIQVVHVLKWNPFTFLLVGNQIVEPSFSHATMLSTGAMIGGTLVYTVIFGCIAYLGFRRRSV